MTEVGGMTVYVTAKSLVQPDLPYWHLPRTAGGDPLVFSTLCGRVIAEWPPGDGPPQWKAVPIRRMFAGTFAIQCGTCKRSAQSRGVS